MSSWRSGASLEHVLSSIAAVSSLGAIRVERWIARSIGTIGLVYGLMTVLVMVNDGARRFDFPEIGVLIAALQIMPLALVVLATPWPRWQRRASILFTGGFFAAVLLWLRFVIDPSDGPNWTWYLCTVASAAAAQCLSKFWALVYTGLVALFVALGGVVDSTSGPSGLQGAVMDGIYVLILGVLVVVLVDLFRDAVRRVDTSARSALDEYRAAVTQTAQEIERAEVDALVHDTVLASLHAAAQADTAQRQAVAAGMAEDAIVRLATAVNLAGPAGESIPLSLLKRELFILARSCGAPILLHSRGSLEGEVPHDVARALQQATSQALTNSVQHAGHGAIPRELSLMRAPSGDVIIEVSDRGRGFEPARVAPGRLGVRVSILARVEAVGATARIVSSPGAGCRVVLRWSPPDAQRGRTR